MKKENGYDENYTVNKETIFGKSKEELQKIFEDYPYRGKIIAQIFEMHGLYPGFYCFSIQH